MTDAEEQKKPAPIYKHSSYFHTPTRGELENSLGWDQLSDRAKKRRMMFALNADGEQATVNLTDAEHFAEVAQKYSASPNKAKLTQAEINEQIPQMRYLRGEETVDFSGKNEPEDKNATTEVLLMAISRWNCGGYYDLGMITADMRFRHMVFAFKKYQAMNLTVGVEKLLSRIFKKYQLSPRTKILFEDNVSRSCPLVLYLELAQKYVGFDVKYRDFPRIMSRLLTVYPAMSPGSFFPGTLRLRCKLTRNNVQKYADFALEFFSIHGQCPWITSEAYGRLRKMSVRNMRKSMRPYLMLFYMAISARRAKATITSDAKRRARKAAQQQNLSTQTDSGEILENET